MFALGDYDFELPAALIAQHPAPQRDQSRLMLLNRANGALQHRHFRDLNAVLTPQDLLVINDTRVVPARLFGRKPSGGRVEILILDYVGGQQRFRNDGHFICDCLVRAAKRPRPGTHIEFAAGLTAEVLASRAEIHTLRFESKGALETHLESLGRMPLPPYIRRAGDAPESPEDRERYQTVYARHPGAVAAPTAGLHFTDAMLAQMAAAGIPLVRLTLHVGYGTFVPVRVSDIRQHRMHAERYQIRPEAAAQINRHRARGGRVIAVGTTCVRALEFAADAQGRLQAGEGVNDLFMYPGYRFRLVDGMITNFHLPQSTLLMLVAAFAGREQILAAYAQAVAAGYRFFSYGDAMFIHPARGNASQEGDSGATV
jgi:S-adenosylmethionine:tRNA ribosyltransferase-isomerase